MRVIEIKIPITGPTGEETKVVKAYAHSHPHLAIHRMWTNPQDPRTKKYARLWCITHIPTGLRIASEIPRMSGAFFVADAAIETLKHDYDLGSSDVSKAAACFDLEIIRAKTGEARDK